MDFHVGGNSSKVKPFSSHGIIILPLLFLAVCFLFPVVTILIDSFRTDTGEWIDACPEARYPKLSGFKQRLETKLKNNEKIQLLRTEGQV